ncbi:hypothetical protein DYL59_01655 [Pseudomonas kairouanensis]|uniref:Uncharacterized protein n=1 Tax=Pseudomonas kairouanensis TaxID=2293832 RepID=A0A4Z0B2N2_9PSED|nr:hypothetical protein [Pseudomonas kairouanensis]TFY92689.1 hypothetical protein DYL59_01655 [Pseudomonas kairouanensis]
MSLKLTVIDNKALKSLLTKMDKDKNFDIKEFIQLRDFADTAIDSLPLLAIKDNLRVERNAADIFVDGLKMLVLELRRLDFGVPDKDPAKEAQKEVQKAAIRHSIESQIAYMLQSYNFLFGKL